MRSESENAVTCDRCAMMVPAVGAVRNVMMAFVALVLSVPAGAAPCDHAGVPRSRR